MEEVQVFLVDVSLKIFILPFFEASDAKRSSEFPYSKVNPNPCPNL